jgi:hypothetical protein
VGVGIADRKLLTLALALPVRAADLAFLIGDINLAPNLRSDSSPGFFMPQTARSILQPIRQWRRGMEE